MNNLLNAMKRKLNHIKQNGKVRMILISAFALLLIFSITFAWYINNVDLWGIEFKTGNIQFNAYVYDADGKPLVDPVESKEENETIYLNVPLTTIEDAAVGSTGTVYIAIESTGSLGIQYKLAFESKGQSEASSTYLGGYKYNISKVTDQVEFSTSGNINVGNCPAPEKINNELSIIDRNPVTGIVEDQNGYDIYRFDYTLAEKNEEYTESAINIYFNIFATQIGGDFEDTEERGYTYYCATQADIDRVKVEAYPGDIIKLSADVVYYGDLVFNKPIHLETNDYKLTVNGNLMYDYVLGNSLRIEAGGLGSIVVQCTKEGVGGNFKIKAPISNVTLAGSNASNGDIIVEKSFTVDATDSVGDAGVSFNNTRIVDGNNARKMVYLESNTRATVSFGTTIGAIQSVGKANNIEIVNNGVIGEINLSNMSELGQTNSPQIYILNNNDIDKPIVLPSWSVKFVVAEDGKCTGNTRIIQSLSGSPMTVSGNCEFDNYDIEVEKQNVLVEQIYEGNDSKLKIYYQDVDGQTTTIQSILEDYFKNDVTSGGKITEVTQLEIISIGTKAITNADIVFLNSKDMLALQHLDMQRANIIDTSTNTPNKLASSAFYNVTKYNTLVLPQNLEEIGDRALEAISVENVVTIPADVTTFGNRWIYNGKYVCFASSVPLPQAVSGLTGISAIFVDEAYIDSYKNAYSGFATKIYPNSVLDVTKQHFVRNTVNDEWEITYFIGGDEQIIGDRIIIDGKILNITSVYAHAYRHNFVASDVKFADSVEDVGDGNFYSNKNVTSLKLNKVKNIGSDVFAGCANLAQVDFGTALESIGANAFLSCVSITNKITLPDTMQKIGACAFQGTKIEHVNTGGTTSIDGKAFYACKSLISAELPKVRVIGENGTNALFESCELLVSVSMPQLTKVNGQRMFAACSSLRELYLSAIDDGLSLGNLPFPGASGVVKLYVPEEHLTFFQSKSPGGIAASMIYPQGEKMGEELVNGFNIGQYIVKENSDASYTIITSNIHYEDQWTLPTEYEGLPITAIYANAFRNQRFSNVSIYFGKNLRSIGSGAFYGRNGIVAIDFGTSVEIIGSSAFSYCSGLRQDVVLPMSMTTIESEAFAYSGITSIRTGGTTLIQGQAFYSCTELVSAELPEVTVIAENGKNELFVLCSSLVSVSMPKLSKAYGQRMFVSCSALKELTMGSKDVGASVGLYPFAGLDSSGIKLYVPESLVSFYQGKNILPSNQVFPIGEKMGDKSVNGYVIGDYILLDNGDGYTLVTSNLDFSGKVTLPEEYNGKPITSIYANAFRNQGFADTELRLGNQIKVIGDGAFYGRTGLTTIVMDQVTTVGKDAFYGSGLKTLNAPKLTSIGNNAFRKCVSLELVNIPRVERVESTYVFSECSNLKSVYFEDVMYLDRYTFNGCKKLEKITINKLINSSLDNMPAAMTIEASAPCKIYVPYRSLSYYTNPWSGKPVVTFDITASHNGNTYILEELSAGRYVLIDFNPSGSVTSLVLPRSLSTDNGSVSIYSIKYGAFTTVADTLKEITLSSTVAQLESDALAECGRLENIFVASGNVFFKSISGVLYSSDDKMLVKYPAGRSGSFDMTDYGYQHTVGIGATAFANASKLTEIVFPSTLMVVDSTAFKNCGSLRTVEFTGETPPTLMGAGIFNTAVEAFEMVIPTDSGDVVTDYLCSYGFAEYEPFIDLKGHAAPDSSVLRNQVPLTNSAAKNAVVPMLTPEKEEEEDTDESPDEETTGGDEPEPPEEETEAILEAEVVTEVEEEVSIPE